MSNVGKYKIQVPSGVTIKKKSYGPFYQLFISRGTGPGFGIVLPKECTVEVVKNILSVEYSTSPEM